MKKHRIYTAVHIRYYICYIRLYVFLLILLARIATEVIAAKNEITSSVRHNFLCWRAYSTENCTRFVRYVRRPWDLSGFRILRNRKNISFLRLWPGGFPITGYGLRNDQQNRQPKSGRKHKCLIVEKCDVHKPKKLENISTEPSCMLFPKKKFTKPLASRVNGTSITRTETDYFIRVLFRRCNLYAYACVWL